MNHPHGAGRFVEPDQRSALRAQLGTLRNRRSETALTVGVHSKRVAHGNLSLPAAFNVAESAAAGRMRGHFGQLSWPLLPVRRAAAQTARRTVHRSIQPTIDVTALSANELPESAAANEQPSSSWEQRWQSRMRRGIADAATDTVAFDATGSAGSRHPSSASQQLSQLVAAAPQRVLPWRLRLSQLTIGQRTVREEAHPLLSLSDTYCPGSDAQPATHPKRPGQRARDLTATGSGRGKRRMPPEQGEQRAEEGRRSKRERSSNAARKSSRAVSRRLSRRKSDRSNRSAVAKGSSGRRHRQASGGQPTGGEGGAEGSARRTTHTTGGAQRATTQGNRARCAADRQASTKRR
jgi:hypothetical protein